MTDTQKNFIAAWNAMAREWHETSRSKGFWDKERNDGEALMLMTSELAECLEAIRHGNPPDDKVPEFSGAEAELGDTLIRIGEFCCGRNWRVAEAVVAKMEFNKTRERLHGNKKF